MPTHLNMRYAEIEALWPGIEAFQKLATQYGVSDIFADNGGKVVQLAIATGLDIVPGRLGADYIDRLGNTYEVKTINLSGEKKPKSRGFTTNHHLTHSTIAKYRERRWVFAIYDNIRLMEAYLVEAVDMEPIFLKWSTQLRDQDHINNPKIPVEFVREIGTVMYMKDVAPKWVSGNKEAA